MNYCRKSCSENIARAPTAEFKSVLLFSQNFRALNHFRLVFFYFLLLIISDRLTQMVNHRDNQWKQYRITLFGQNDCIKHMRNDNSNISDTNTILAEKNDGNFDSCVHIFFLCALHLFFILFIQKKKNVFLFHSIYYKCIVCIYHVQTWHTTLIHTLMQENACITQWLQQTSTCNSYIQCVFYSLSSIHMILYMLTESCFVSDFSSLTEFS